MRLYDAVAHLLTRAAARRALILTLDDLHWADLGSLQLLQHVTREVSRSPVLIIGTYRDTDVDRGHPLAAALVDLNREQLIERVALRPLARSEVADYVAAAAGTRISEELLDQLHDETGGNPFFLQEVVTLMIQEGGVERTARMPALPEGVRNRDG